jgi:hypothetical protein
MKHGRALSVTHHLHQGQQPKEKMIGEKNIYNISTLFSTFTGDSSAEMISPDAGKRCHRNFIPLKDRRSM